MSRLRALFDEVRWPPSWRTIQWMQGFVLVIAGASAITATDRWTIVVAAFLVGNAFATICSINIIQRYRRMIDEMRGDVDGVLTAFGPFRGRIVMMEVHESEEDVEPTRNLH